MDFAAIILVIVVMCAFVAFICAVTNLLVDRYSQDGRRRRSIEEIWKESDR